MVRPQHYQPPADDKRLAKIPMQNAPLALTVLGDTLQGWLGRDPLERGRELLQRGEPFRAINCLSRSDFPAAAILLSRTALEDGRGAVRMSAVSGLAKLGRRDSREVREEAIGTLMDLCSSRVEDVSMFAAIALRGVLRSEADPRILGRISKRACATCDEVASRAGQGQQDLQVPKSDVARERLTERMCTVLGGLRDPRSAEVIKHALVAAEKHAQETSALQVIVDSIAMRPFDSELDAAVRRIKAQAEQGLVHQVEQKEAALNYQSSNGAIPNASEQQGSLAQGAVNS